VTHNLYRAYHPTGIHSSYDLWISSGSRIFHFLSSRVDPLPANEHYVRQHVLSNYPVPVTSYTWLPSASRLQLMISLSRAIKFYNVNSVMKHSKNHLKWTPLSSVSAACLSACPSVNPTVYINYIIYIHLSISLTIICMYIYKHSASVRRDCHLTNTWQDTTLRITQLTTIKYFYSDCNIDYAYNGGPTCGAVQHWLAVQTLTVLS
jgi:hypothetical protein